MRSSVEPIDDNARGEWRASMFVQVIQGQVSDAAEVRAQFERWVAEVSSGATGWLGSTIWGDRRR